MQRWQLAFAAAAFIGALAVYVPSLSSAVAYGDVAEAQTVPYILGIAHPTGFPAVTLAGWLFTHLLAVGTVAWRMNAFAAVCVALTAAGIVALAAALECEPLAGLCAALVFAFGVLAWQEAVLAGFQVPAVPAVLFALALAVRFARSGSRRAIAGAAAVAGLGVAAHPLAILVLPGLAVAAGWRWRRIGRRTLVAGTVALVAPLLLYLYLPIRSSVVAAGHLDPAAAAPLFDAGAFDWDTNQPRTPKGFMDEVLARRESPGGAIRNIVAPRAVIEAFTLFGVAAAQQYSAGILILVALGFLALTLRDVRALSIIAAGGIGGLLFASVYRYDSNVQAYLLASLAIAAALAASATRLPIGRVPPALVNGVVTLVLAIFVTMAWSAPRRFRDGTMPNGQQVIDAVRSSVPDGAIVVAAWNEAATLGYGETVENALGTRTVIAAWPAQFAGSYPYWTRFRRVVIDVDASGFSQLQYLPATWLRRLPSSSQSQLFFEIVAR